MRPVGPPNDRVPPYTHSHTLSHTLSHTNTHTRTPHRAPVFRELYSEKRVIEEERRLRVDDSPLGRCVGCEVQWEGVCVGVCVGDAGVRKSEEREAGRESVQTHVHML